MISVTLMTYILLEANEAQDIKHQIQDAEQTIKGLTEQSQTCKPTQETSIASQIEYMQTYIQRLKSKLPEKA